MKSISVVNIKGGVGKTTASVNLAAGLNRYHQKKTLVVDCDAQRNSTEYLTVNHSQGINGTVLDLFKDKPIESIITNVEFNAPVKKHAEVSLIAGDKDLGQFEPKDITIIRNRMASLKKQYDFCFFDCPPAMTPVSLSAICASDYILVPANVDTDSLGGYADLIDIVTNIRRNTPNHKLEILGILFNDAEPRTALDKFLISELQENFGSELFGCTIRHSTAIKAARYMGQPLCVSGYEKTIAGEDYKLFTEYFLKRIERKSKKK